MNSLMELLERKLIMAATMIRIWVNDVKKDERGDTNFVSIMIIIVIILAVAVIFRDALKQLVESVMDSITKFIEETSG